MVGKLPQEAGVMQLGIAPDVRYHPLAIARGLARLAMLARELATQRAELAEHLVALRLWQDRQSCLALRQFPDSKVKT